MAIPKKPNFEPLPLPDEPGLLGGWGRKLEVTLLRFLLDTFNKIMSPFWEMRDSATKWLFQGIEDELKPVIEPLLDKIDAHSAVPPEIKAMTKHLRFSEPITFAAIASAFIVSAIVGILLGFVEPVKRIFAQEADSYIHSARMTPQEAFAALKRGAISEDDYHNHLSDGGWSEELEETWLTILSPLLEIGDIGRLYTREEMTEAQFNEQLEIRGYKTEEIAKVKTLLHVIPPLVDIIRMAVREAFNTEIVEEFKLHAELPGEMVEWAKKQGLSKDWAKAYWASHWQLPGLTMGYEMLHRDVISQDQMEMLIKAQDVSPFWRDKLIDISYKPYTRVDIRRMHAMGVVSVEEVYRNYRDLGYDHEKATKMTEFTIAFNQTNERDLTRTDILYGYEHAFFEPKETDDLLIGLGYSQEEADYYKAKVDFKRWQVMVKETVKLVGQQYVANQIDESEVYSQLGALNLPGAQINRYVLAWDMKKKTKAKQLTSSILTNFLNKEVITESNFREEMSGLGYSDKYIQWFLDFMGIE